MCTNGACTHAAVANGVPCEDDNNACTEDVCKGRDLQSRPHQRGDFRVRMMGISVPTINAPTEAVHISNDPPPVTEDQCFPVGELVADSGPVSGNWNTCGVADQFDYACNGPNCSNTGAISTWPCADPSFVYEGEETGFEYAYVFVAPIDGTCTFIEYGEGIKLPGSGNNLFGVLDWFLLTGGGCNANACVGYTWENVKGDPPTCGGGNGTTCSYLEFPVSEGQVFYLVGDLFNGAGSCPGLPVQHGLEYRDSVRCLGATAS